MPTSSRSSTPTASGKGLGSRSEALERAIRSLRDRSLEGAYAAAIDEWAASDDAAAWDALAGDGLGPDAPG